MPPALRGPPATAGAGREAGAVAAGAGREAGGAAARAGPAAGRTGAVRSSSAVAPASAGVVQ
nr:MAG: hypothetical protein DIU70_05990 [Bacillota bacterium]